jgi:phosphatidylglycerol:prolipoprotein diacylglycerol transferase
MLGLSLVLGWYMSLTLAERDGLPRDTLANCYVVTILAAVVSARLFYFATNPGEYTSFRDLFALWRGGLVAYGGFLGGFFTSMLFIRRYRLPLWPWADVTAPALAAGLMLTRVGCYMFGCDFGKPLGADAPDWLKRLGTFPHWPEGTVPHSSGSPAWAQHVKHLGLAQDAAASLPVHPTQIYESLVGACLLVLLLLVRRHQRFRGQLFLTLVFAYGALRFLLELIRDDLERGEFGPYLPEHMAIAGALVLFGGAFAFGIAQTIGSIAARRVAQVAAFIPAVVAYFLLAPPSFGEPTIVQFSTSQWVGLLTAIPAAVAYGVFLQAAKLHPEQAMAIHLPAVAAEAVDPTAVPRT